MQAKPYCCSTPITTAPPPMPANTPHHLDTCAQVPVICSVIKTTFIVTPTENVSECQAEMHKACRSMGMA